MCELKLFSVINYIFLRSPWYFQALRSRPAALLRTNTAPTGLLPEPGATCLYRGASYGGTVSFVHDMVCGSGNHLEGQIIAVEIAPRAMRELAALASQRPGLVPVLGDARLPHTVSPYIRGKADWIHQDLSMADQAETCVKMAGAFLKPGGTGLLSLKAASERSSDGDDDTRFAKAERILGESELEVVERIELAHPHQDNVGYRANTKAMLLENLSSQPHLPDNLTGR